MLILLLFLVHFLRAFIHSTCESTKCSSGCCIYYSREYASDSNCTTKFCSCSAYSSDCPSLNSNFASSSKNKIGYHFCSCSSGCCFYTKQLSYFDYYCTSSYCGCISNINYCLTISSPSSAIKTGYNSCSTLSCLTGCCYYSASLNYFDYFCYSSYCHCSPYSSNCSSTSLSLNTSSSILSSSVTTFGYHYCSSFYCSDGCCYYSVFLNYSDYYCRSSYCTCVSYDNCSSLNDDPKKTISTKSYADALTLASGETYIVVNYNLYKTLVGFGWALGGIFIIIDIILWKRLKWKKNSVTLFSENN